MTPLSTPETARDAAILEHLRRYHLTTPEILHQLFFEGLQRNAVTKVTSRLREEGRISKPLRLFEQRTYFVLSPREAVRLGEHRSIGKKFEYQGLVNAYGLLSFCVLNGVRKFTPKEFTASFPDFIIPGVRLGNYYIEPEKTPEGLKRRLGFVHVDYGTSVPTVIKKVRKIRSRAFTLPAFAGLIHSGNFIIAIVAPSAAKAEEIRTALAFEPASPIRYRITVSTDLGELLTRRGRLKENRRSKKTRPTGESTP